MCGTSNYGLRVKWWWILIPSVYFIHFSEVIDIICCCGCFPYLWLFIVFLSPGAHDGTVGWGTVLQTRRSWVRFPMVSLEFFIDIIHLATLTPLWLTQPLTEVSTRTISLGVKAAGAYGWQPYHRRVPIVLKSRIFNFLEPSGPE